MKMQLGTDDIPWKAVAELTPPQFVRVFPVDKEEPPISLPVSILVTVVSEAPINVIP